MNLSSCIFYAVNVLDEDVRRMAMDIYDFKATVFGTVQFSRIVTPSSKMDFIIPTDEGKQYKLGAFMNHEGFFALALSDCYYEVEEKDKALLFKKEYFLNRYIADISEKINILGNPDEDEYVIAVARDDREFYEERRRFIKVTNHTALGDFEYNYSEDTLLNSELRIGDKVGMTLELCDYLGRRALEITAVDIYETKAELATKKSVDKAVIEKVIENNRQITRLFKENYDMLLEQGLVAGRFSNSEDIVRLLPEDRAMIPEQNVKSRFAYESLFSLIESSDRLLDLSQDSERQEYIDKLLQRFKFKDMYRYLINFIRLPGEIQKEFRRQYVVECSSIMEALLHIVIYEQSGRCSNCTRRSKCIESAKNQNTPYFYVSNRFAGKEFTFKRATKKLVDMELISSAMARDIENIYDRRNSIHISKEGMALEEVSEKYVDSCERLFNCFYIDVVRFLANRKNKENEENEKNTCPEY